MKIFEEVIPTMEKHYDKDGKLSSITIQMTVELLRELIGQTFQINDIIGLDQKLDKTEEVKMNITEVDV